MWSYIDDRNDHSFDKGSVLFLFHKNCFYKNKRLKIVKTLKISRSSRPDVFLRKVVLKIWSKFTGEHSCWNVISIKLQNNFIEITLRHGCSPVNLLYIFITPFPQNTSWRLLLEGAEASIIIIKNLIHMILKSKVLRFGNKYYRQITGTIMGTPVVTKLC